VARTWFKVSRTLCASVVLEDAHCLVDSAYNFTHNLVPFHSFMTLSNLVPANHLIHFALEFSADDTIQGMFQELILQFLLILRRP
jgi:hypothetical protein